LSGPAELIYRIERSLFAQGVVTVRLEAADAGVEGHESLLQSMVQSGLLALVVTPAEVNTLTARAKNEQVTLNANNPDEHIAAVHELLVRAGILVAHENADWEI
jgi:hypothetical protein